LAVPLLVLAGIGGSIALSIRKPETPILGFTELMVWLDTAFTTGVAGVILWPLRQVALLSFSPDAASFGLRLLPVLALLLLHYLWVMRCDAAFEEEALALSQKIARTIEAARRGRLSAERASPSPRRARSPLFALAPTGPAWRAISWKNFLALTRELSPKFLLIIFLLSIIAFGVLSAVAADPGEDDEALDLPVVFGGILAACAAMFGLFTSTLMREDMRRDLENVDLLKTFPLRGRELLRGEVLGGTFYAAGIQIALILASASFMAASSTRPFSVFEIVAVALSAAILFPCFGYLSLVLENGMVILFPAWILPEKGMGPGTPQGMENMGRMMVLGFVRLLGLGILLLPPGLVAGIGIAVGYIFLGIVAVPIGAGIAAVGILIEAECLLWWFGRCFETLDPSAENL
jgi:hypothetical protein